MVVDTGDYVIKISSVIYCWMDCCQIMFDTPVDCLPRFLGPGPALALTLLIWGSMTAVMLLVSIFLYFCILENIIYAKLSKISIAEQ